MINKIKNLDPTTKAVVKIVAVQAATIAAVVVIDRLVKKNEN